MSDMISDGFDDDDTYDLSVLDHIIAFIMFCVFIFMLWWVKYGT